MRDWLRGAQANTGALGDLFSYLWKNKQWWLIPMVTVLLIIGLFLTFVTVSGLGPFIYSLF